MSKPSDPAARAYATLALVDAMTRLHAISPEGLTPVLRDCWNQLERTALDTLPGADLSLIGDHSDMLHARSAALLALLPDSDELRYRVSYSNITQMLGWICPDHLELAIRKGFYPYGGIPELFDHAPGDAAWDRLLCEVLSPRQFAYRHGSEHQAFVLSMKIAEVKNLDRLAAFLEAQVRHHPERMAGQLMRALLGHARHPGTALALILAGARVENASSDFKAPPETAKLARLAASNHGRIEIARKYGPLVEALGRITKRPDLSDIQT